MVRAGTRLAAPPVVAARRRWRLRPVGRRGDGVGRWPAGRARGRRGSAGGRSSGPLPRRAGRGRWSHMFGPPGAQRGRACRAAPSGFGRRVRPPVGGSGGRRLRSWRHQGPRPRLRGIPGGRGRARDHCGRCPRPLDGPGPVPGAGRARRLRRRRGRPRPGDRRGPVPAPAGPAPPPPPTAGCRRPGRARRLHLPADGGGGGRGHHVTAGGTRPRPAVRLPLLLAAGRGPGRLGGVPAGPAGGGRPLPRLRPPGGGRPRPPPAAGGRRPGGCGAGGAGGRGGRGMGGQPAGPGGQRRRGAGAVRHVGPAGRGGVGPPADGRCPR